MNINIYGSTGVIGRKTLELIDVNFPNIKNKFINIILNMLFYMICINLKSQNLK